MVAKNPTWTYRKCILTELFSSPAHLHLIILLSLIQSGNLTKFSPPASSFPYTFTSIWPSLPFYFSPMQSNVPVFSSFSLVSLNLYYPYTITFLFFFLFSCSSLLVIQWVAVTHVVNPSHFYVRYVAEKREHEVLSKRINSFVRRDNCHFTSNDTMETGVWRN